MNTKTPTITLVGLKHIASMSEETNCFTTRLAVDDIIIGEAMNRGTGGCTCVYLNEKGRAIPDLIAADALSEFEEGSLQSIIDRLVDAAINAKAHAKFIAKVRKQGVECLAYVTKDAPKGSYRSFKKGLINDLNRADCVARITAKPDFHKFTNEMTEAEILAHFAN
jgi:hypothetical protein